jgi:hypothetical protein
VQNANKSEDLQLQQFDSNNSKASPEKSPHKSARSEIKSEIKSGSEIESVYENTFESLGDVLKGSDDVFNQPFHIDTLKEVVKSSSKDSIHSSINDGFKSAHESDHKVKKSAENPFELVDTRDSPQKLSRSKSKDKKLNLR